jgi:hypothetical protein
MSTLQITNKKTQFVNILDEIYDHSKYLYRSLDNVYENQTLETEQEFIKSCNHLQNLAKKALDATGYYKSLCGVKREIHAPEELQGDVEPFKNYVNCVMSSIEEELKEGKKVKPIEAPDLTKEEWLKTIDEHKILYKKIYDESKEYFNKTEDKTWVITPVETKIILDDDIINLASGFMPGPIGLFRNKMVDAITQVFDNINEMKIFLLVQCKTRDMVLYMTYEKAGQFYWRGAFVYKA